jgi:hypothetical protein
MPNIKRFIKFNFTTVFYILILLLTPRTALAVDDVTTGLGDITPTPEGIAGWFLKLGLGTASGIALLLIMAGAIKYITSSGDPKAVQEAQKTITSAIVGFLVIFLSVLILGIIGGPDVLNISGWQSDFFKP